MSPEDKARLLQKMQTFQEELVKKWIAFPEEHKDRVVVILDEIKKRIDQTPSLDLKLSQFVMVVGLTYLTLKEPEIEKA